MSMMMTTGDEQLNLILSKLVHRDEDVKSKSSNNVEKPLHFVSYVAAAVVAMTASLANPDDGDDLEGDADDEMEEDEDDNGDDCNGGRVGVPVEIVGYGVIIDDDNLEGDVDGGRCNNVANDDNGGEVGIPFQMIAALQEDKKALERLTKTKESALLEAERILQSALERALIVEEEENRILEKNKPPKGFRG
ncbi:hypothetical protein ACFX2C_037190 [Malus domestica]